MKKLVWIGSSKKDLNIMPESVKDDFGYALHLAQVGEKHDKAKPMHGFGSAGVLEITANHTGNAYRAIYTVIIKGTVYVLHCFEKKSTSGISTPKPDMDLIRKRFEQVKLKYEGKS